MRGSAAGSWVWWLAACAGLVLALGAGTWKLLAGGTRGAEIATVLALLVAVLGLLIAAGSLVVAVRSSDMSEEKLAGQARRLAGVVWKQEAAALLRLVGDMGDARPAEVEFTRPDLVFWRADGGDLRGSLSQIKGYYRGLERGRLVVRGPAGWGKTVLAIQLVCDLAAAIVGIDTTAAGSTSAVRVLVPVRVSAPAFNPAVGGCDLAEMTGEELADRFDAWLGEQLVAGYGVSEKVAAALATGGWVLPVLDGVDEMDPPETPPRRAAALMVALNQPTALGARAVVLTCRTDLYHLLVAARPTYSGDRDVLQDATVVDVQPLRAEAVRDYLCYRFPDHACSERGEPRWRPVLDRLTMDRAEDPVVAVLRSPLRLFLALTAYGPGSDPNDLIRHAAAGSDLDERLFAGLIPAITTNHPRPDGRRYPATQVTRWLTTLARHLRDQERAGRSGTDLHLNELWSAAGDRAP
ncbi:MAG TPA: NTPase, partial [Pseudonocardiaceae bacterium]|nr:NTPase [Pseudonocardiaceae bacterium]